MEMSTAVYPDLSSSTFSPIKNKGDDVQGDWSGIAIAGKYAVLAYRSTTAKKIRYQVGVVDNQTHDVAWYDADDANDIEGSNPDIAINIAGTVIETHYVGNSESEFRIGIIDKDGRLSFAAKRHPFKTDKVAKVAINKTVSGQEYFVLFYEKEVEGKPRMCYIVGLLDDNGAIKDMKEYTLENHVAGGSATEGGEKPGLAMNNINTVVIAYQSKGTSSNLWYHVGVLEPEKLTIHFELAMTKFGAGSYPSLGVSDGNIIILTYQSKNLHHLYQLTGDVIPSHKTIEWQGDVSKYSDGEMNAVGIDTGLAVAVHRRYNTTLYYGSAPFSSLKNWIWDLREEVKDLTLKEIVLPSSHDASMYGVTRCLNGGSTCNTVTQTHSIREQLLAGCRWFDIRPYLENDDTYSVGHWAYIDLKVLGKHWAGCNNGSLAAIFRQFKDYYDIDGGKDFVVLQFTNYIDPETEGHYHFTAEQMEALIKWVSKELDGYLFMPGSEYADRRLTDLPLEVFLTSKGKIIPVFKGLDGVSERPEGIYTYQQIGAPTDKCGADVCVFDNYSNTASVDELKKDQLAKYRNTDNHSEDWLYMLSWTLTQTPLQAVFCYILGLAPTILDMAKDANSELFPTLADLWSGNEISYGHMPNLISVDAYSARIGGAALWLTSLLLTAASGADLKSQAL